MNNSCYKPMLLNTSLGAQQPMGSQIKKPGVMYPSNVAISVFTVRNVEDYFYLRARELYNNNEKFRLWPKGNRPVQ